MKKGVDDPMTRRRRIRRVLVVTATQSYQTKKSNKYDFTDPKAGVRGFIYVEKTRQPPRELHVLFEEDEEGGES
jgi:hypothetical protein